MAAPTLSSAWRRRRSLAVGRGIASALATEVLVDRVDLRPSAAGCQDQRRCQGARRMRRRPLPGRECRVGLLPRPGDPKPRRAACRMPLEAKARDDAEVATSPTAAGPEEASSARASQRRSRPSGVTIVSATRLSHVSPSARPESPMPPPWVSPPTPTEGQEPVGSIAPRRARCAWTSMSRAPPPTRTSRPLTLTARRRRRSSTMAGRRVPRVAVPAGSRGQRDAVTLRAAHDRLDVACVARLHDRARSAVGEPLVVDEVRRRVRLQHRTTGPRERAHAAG